MSSNRLPGKTLMSLGDDFVLGCVVNALRRTKLASGMTVTTSQDPSDDPIANWCRQVGVDCYRGALEDVAGRALAAAHAVGAEAFVRISGDSPLIDPALVDHAISLFRLADFDLVTNVFPRSFPRGQSVEVVRVSALAAAYAGGLSGAEKEHVTTALYTRSATYSIVNFTVADLEQPPHEGASSEVNLAVDEFLDLERCRGIVQALYPQHPWEAGWHRCASIGAKLEQKL
jgi:spore coat polysaccharide biosynthesis protein SpsF (cytidylyltransferase family)